MSPAMRLTRKFIGLRCLLCSGLAVVFERVVDGLDHAAFAQHQLVLKLHQPVLHVVTHRGNELYAFL